MRPACGVSPWPTGNQAVIVTCSVMICGTASIPLNLTMNGTTVKVGKNTVIWRTTDDDVANTEVKCLANFGDAVECSAGKSPI